MKCYSFFLLCFVLFSIPCSLQAQSNIVQKLERSVPGQGRVTIHQDEGITALLGIEYQGNGVSGEQKTLKVAGYRVQVYAGTNSRQARSDAFNKAGVVKEYFPDLAIYTHFSAPRWLCRVGDFKSIEEADAMMRKLKATGVFKEVSIVRESINIPL